MAPWTAGQKLLLFVIVVLCGLCGKVAMVNDSLAHPDALADQQQEW